MTICAAGWKDAHSTDRTKLANDVRQFLNRFADLLDPDQKATPAKPAAPSVVVSVLDAAAEEKDILQAVSRALKEHGK